MNGGTIEQTSATPEGIILQVRGTGHYRFQRTEVTINPTNYRLRPGDLVWWEFDELRWEGRPAMRFPCTKLAPMTATV